MTLYVKREPLKSLYYYLKITFPISWEETGLINYNHCVTWGLRRGTGMPLSPKVSYSAQQQGHDKYPWWQSLFRTHVYLPCCVSVREQREICPLVTEWGQSIIIGVTKGWQILPHECNKNEQITAILRNFGSDMPTNRGCGLQLNTFLSVPRPGEPPQLGAPQLFGHWKESQLWRKARIFVFSGNEGEVKPFRLALSVLSWISCLTAIPSSRWRPGPERLPSNCESFSLLSRSWPGWWGSDQLGEAHL